MNWGFSAIVSIDGRTNSLSVIDNKTAVEAGDISERHPQALSTTRLDRLH